MREFEIILFQTQSFSIKAVYFYKEHQFKLTSCEAFEVEFYLNGQTGCSLASNIAILSHNIAIFDRQIAPSNLQPTRTNCKLKFTKVL